MCAKIMTNKEPIKPGYKMDIYHASSAIQYVNIFITDRYMKNLVKNSKIDALYIILQF